jgi:hypothetical protein
MISGRRKGLWKLGMAFPGCPFSVLGCMRAQGEPAALRQLAGRRDALGHRGGALWERGRQRQGPRCAEAHGPRGAGQARRRQRWQQLCRVAQQQVLHWPLDVPPLLPPAPLLPCPLLNQSVLQLCAVGVTGHAW